MPEGVQTASSIQHWGTFTFQKLVCASKSLLWKQILLLTDVSSFKLVVCALNGTIIVPHLQQSSKPTSWESMKYYSQYILDALFIYLFILRKIAIWKNDGPNSQLMFLSPIPLILSSQREWKLWDTDNTDHSVQRILQM